MTIGETGRPYIAVRRKVKEEKKVQGRAAQENKAIDEGEQYMIIGEDGRPYIAVRKEMEEEKEKT